MAAIWQDYPISLGNYDRMDYTVSADGAVIYTGTAYRRPGAATIEITVNDICADYLRQTFPAVGANGVYSAAVSKTFTVTPATGTAQTVTFEYDWSYDYDAPSPNVLSAPIIRTIDGRMPLIYTQIQSGPVVAHLVDGGEASDLSFTVPSGGGNIVLAPNQVAEGSITIGGITYRVVGSCERHALYYVNEYGGWDALLCRFIDRKTDTYTRAAMQTAASNEYPDTRSRYNYRNGIARRWVLQSGWLTDEQAGRMHHLLGSTLVYLYDLVEGRAYPVVLTNAECAYKTFRNNGRQMVNYELNVELAAERERR